MKRLFLFLFAVLTMSAALWAQGGSVLTYSYNSTNMTASVTGHTSLSSTLEIPSSVDNGGNTYTVTSIGASAFVNCTTLTSVTIPNSVTSIGYRAFYGCSGITGVTIPNSVTSIGQEAFASSGLTSITIPSGVTSIGNKAFQNCTSLSSVVYNATSCAAVSSADYPMFSGCSHAATLTIGAGVTSIPNYAFKNFTGLNTVTFLGNNITQLGKSVFQNCSHLQGITIPNEITTIGDYCFASCTSLTSLVLPSSLTTIGQHAFSGCTQLSSITISAGLSSVGNYAFNACNNLNTVNYLGTIKQWCGITFGQDNSNPISVGGHRFFINGSQVIELELPSDLTTINAFAFQKATTLTKVTFQSHGVTVRQRAFEGCTGLTRVDYDGTLKEWCENNFVLSGVTNTDWYYSSNPLYSAHKLYLNGTLVDNLVIPDDVTSIGTGCFAGCNEWQSITIGTGLTSIGQGAFWGCTSVTDLTYNARSLTIENNSSALDKVYFLFRSLTGLRNVVVGEGVTSLPNYVFRSCSLTSVTIPSTVTSIGTDAFVYCNNLATVYDHSNLAITKQSDDNGKVAKYATRVEKILTDNRGDFNAPSTYTVEKVTYTRSYEQGKRSTLCLPFKPTSVSPEGLKYYSFNSFNGSTIYFEEVAFNDLAANTPYMVEWPATKTAQDYVFSATDATIVASNSTTRTVNGGNGGSFNGTIARTCMNNTCYGYRDGYFVQSGNGSACNGGHAHVNPFRAYFQITSSSPSGSNPSGLAADFSDGDNLGIDEVDTDSAVESSIRYSTDVYDLMGRIVRKNADNLNGLPRGIYIWKGKKVLNF